MTRDPAAGYRIVTRGADQARWRHRLFSEIRTSPRYEDLMAEARSAHGPIVARPASFSEPGFWLDDDLAQGSPSHEALAKVACDLRLIRQGRPCPWAMRFLHDDLMGRFDPERPPPAMSRTMRRVVEIVASPANMRVSSDRNVDVEDHDAPTLPSTPMQISGQDWDELEVRAAEAGRQAVRELREALTRPTGSDFHDRQVVKAGNHKGRELQLERLALRLTG